MAETTPVAARGHASFNPTTIERASSVHPRAASCTEGEDAATALAPGTPRRRALDAALAEIEAGREGPVVALAAPVRRCCSASSGCCREDEPHLADGTRALRPPGRRAVGHADRAARRGAAQRQRRRQRRRRRGADVELALGRASPARRSSTTRTSPRSRRTGTSRRRPTTTRSSSPRRPRTPTPASASGSSTRPAPARRSPRSASSRPRAPAAS